MAVHGWANRIRARSASDGLALRSGFATMRRSSGWRGRRGPNPFVRTGMPRPTKALHIKRLEAAAAWKRGEKKEAYKLWENAAAGLKEHRDKKQNKKKREAEAAEAAAAASSE